MPPSKAMLYRLTIFFFSFVFVLPFMLVVMVYDAIRGFCIDLYDALSDFAFGFREIAQNRRHDAD